MQNLCETLEQANCSLIQLIQEDFSVLLFNKDFERLEGWYLHTEEDKPACYTIKIDIDGVTYYAEFGYTTSMETYNLYSKQIDLIKKSKK